MNNNLLDEVYKVINFGNCFSCNAELPNKHNHEIYYTSQILECKCGFKFVTYSRQLTLPILNMIFVLEFNYNNDLTKISGSYNSLYLFTALKLNHVFSYSCDVNIFSMIVDLVTDTDLTFEKLRNFAYKINKMYIFQ